MNAKPRQYRAEWLDPVPRITSRNRSTPRYRYADF